MVIRPLNTPLSISSRPHQVRQIHGQRPAVAPTFGHTPKPKNIKANPQQKSRFSMLTLLGTMLLGMTALGGTINKNDQLHRGGTSDTALTNPRAWDDLEVRRPRLPSLNIGWPQNVRVLASSGQDWTSFYHGGENPHGYYTKALVDLLRNNNRIYGFEEAHEVLEATGYNANYAHIYPPSTLRKLRSWQRDEQKPRFAVLIGQLEMADWGGENGFDRAVKADLNNIEGLLRDPNFYNVPKENIFRVDNARLDDVERGLDWLRQQLQANPGAEVLFFYSGHGDTSPPRPDDLEGDSEGELVGPGLRETLFKRWVKEKLGFALNNPNNPAKMLIMLDTCHAGAGSAF